MPRAKPVPVEAPTEPIWWLRSLPYSDYRNTAWWRRRRDTYLATHEQRSCHLCGITHLDAARVNHPIGRIEINFHVHHTTYDHLGYETDDDLVLLCPPCHNLVHRPESHAAKHWVEISTPEHSPYGGYDLAERAAALNPDQ